jgi:hypothetical protein
MELPRRACGDELLRPGEMTEMRRRLRGLAAKHDLTSVIVNAFDPRTRMLPFYYADMKMAPGGVRAIGSAMVDSGFAKTRIVLQQWNPNARPSQMRLEGRIPDLLLISSLRLHSAACDQLIRDACQIEPARRPLIIVGGPRAIYEPWAPLAATPEAPWAADLSVTGEEYVLLSLLETLFSCRRGTESMRSALQRARDHGALDEIPGLVYPLCDSRGIPEELVDTGMQRLLGDLDELPSAALGYRLLEPPSKASGLAAQPIPADRVRKYSRVSSLVITAGCNFHCPYCPIHAYNQGHQRAKSGERVAEEIEQIFDQYGIKLFFGADDNFLGNQQRALEIAETLARKVDAGSRPHCKIRWMTEATIHDTLRMKDHLPTLRKAGLVALWLGVEDISGNLVNKGQAADRTIEAFDLLRAAGIYPIPMLMHHDSQPLFTLKSNRGLLNQLRLLRKAGAMYTQVLMLGPAIGTKWFDDAHTSGLAFESVNGVEIESHMAGGMHVIASRHPRPWLKQFNVLVAYLYFFNPLRMLAAMFWSKSRIPLADAETWPPAGVVDDRPFRQKLMRRIEHKLKAHFIDTGMQLFGILGLVPTLRRTTGWLVHLMRGRIERYTEVPGSPLVMRAPDGGPAAHELRPDRREQEPALLQLPERQKQAA